LIDRADTRARAGISLEYRAAEQSRTMPSRLKSVFALWFVLQIVLPFTAPLQTCALDDLLSASSPHSSASLPHESSATPLPAGPATAASFASPVDASVLRVSTSLTLPPDLVTRGSHTSLFDVSPLSRVQPTVLRL